MPVQMAAIGIKDMVAGIRAELNLFHSGPVITADLCDWELAVNVYGSFARWRIIAAISNMTLVSPLLLDSSSKC